MKKTMRNTLLASAAMLLALPVVAGAADGIIGDCVDCHTMHNSEQGMPVAQRGAAGDVSNDPIENLLRMDCMACHASPDATGKLMTLSGGSVVPQVSHVGGADMLAGGNFAFSTASQRKGHNVIDLTAADSSNASMIEGTATILGAPPGNAHASHHGITEGVFSVDTAFDQFTCAGARGCHGTRSQLLSGSTVDNGTANNYEGVRRTGISAISGAHHNSYDGAKTSDGYTTAQIHDGQVVADGYRFIPGLKGYGNEAARWQNVDSDSHNEYFATAANTVGETAGCGTCHNQGTLVDENGDGTADNWGMSSRAGINSNMPVPGNDMSGFCATCHGVFHSAGSENGTSSAFLRHPSDWVIPDSSEYAAYTTYDITAPVARADVRTASVALVEPGTDMVMCLSCHAAHATANDYMLRFVYSTAIDGDDDEGVAGLNQTAGGYANIAAATGAGGCLACHTTKGVLPENR